MSYDPLSHSRHNAGDRSTKVGHAIMCVNVLNGFTAHAHCDNSVLSNCLSIQIHLSHQQELHSADKVKASCTS